MKIIIYNATEDQPASERFVGRIRHTDDWHPVIFMGADEATLRSRIQGWWDEQIDKVDKRKEPRLRNPRSLAAA